MKFYPEDKPVPEKLTNREFIIRPLRAADVELDYQAVSVNVWFPDDYT